MLEIASLDNVRCRDASFVGPKAARLAEARALGFPVPDALVVPCAASVGVLSAAERTTVSRGVHHGRFEVMSADRQPFASLARAAADLGEPLAVRSSSPLESDPRLAGAFTSFLGVSPADLSTAVLGVWSSALRPTLEDEPERSEPAATAMGVIIQREIQPAFAGTASVAGSAVRIVAVPGSAAPLMAGWRAGVTVVVSDSGTVDDVDAPDGFRAVAVEVAALARRVHGAQRDTLIEWAYADGEVWLLQSRVAVTTASAGPPVAAVAAGGVDVVRMRSARRRVGELAERLWLPWAIAGDVSLTETVARPARLADPLGVWRAFRDTAGRLTATVWGRGADAVAVSDELVRALHGSGDLTPLLAGRPAPVGADVAAFERLAGDLMGHLLATRAIASRFDFWALPANLTQLLLGEPVGLNIAGRTRRAALKWEARLYEAVVAAGDAQLGTPVSEGMGCGPAAVVDVFGFEGEVEAHGLPPRSVLVAARPLPRYAPLLMGAAALVTAGGSEAAHLIEVARSLGIPAVLDCDIAGITRDGHCYLAVDGAAGFVHVLN